MLEASPNMDPPANEGDTKPSTLEEVKEEGPLFSCNLFDAEMVRKVAQEFLPGLASACIDNTTGGLLKSPASVAVDVRREMVDYLTQRSETFVADSVLLEGGQDTEVSDNPFDIISDFIDDFARSKRNFFSKVSVWLLSERREDRIDDFVQEMEINGFWLMGRREAVAQTVIRNVDFKNTFHCNMKFKSEEELAKHVSSCGFREINCENEGCNAIFSAAQLEQHDSTCPFKILQCEQKCPDRLMRREMDRHCITVCPMKLVNCPFYPVGCVSTIPQCTTNQHRLENLQSHLVYILKLLHKEASLEVLKKRAEQVEQASSAGRLAAARDARSLTVAIKNIDAKLGPIEVEKKTEVNAEGAESLDQKEDSAGLSTNGMDSPQKATPTPKVESPAKPEDVVEPTSKTDSSIVEHSAKEDSTHLHSTSRSPEPPIESEGLKSPHRSEESPKSPKKHQDITDSLHKLESPKNQKFPKSPEKVESPKNEEFPKSPKKVESPKSEESTPSPTKHQEMGSPKHVESSPSPRKQHDFMVSPSTMESPKSEESIPSPKKHHDLTASPHKVESPKSEESTPSPKKHHDFTASEDKME